MWPSWDHSPLYLLQGPKEIIDSQEKHKSQQFSLYLSFPKHAHYLRTPTNQKGNTATAFKRASRDWSSVKVGRFETCLLKAIKSIVGSAIIKLKMQNSKMLMKCCSCLPSHCHLIKLAQSVCKIKSYYLGLKGSLLAAGGNRILI